MDNLTLLSQIRIYLDTVEDAADNPTAAIEPYSITLDRIREILDQLEKQI